MRLKYQGILFMKTFFYIVVFSLSLFASGALASQEESIKEMTADEKLLDTFKEGIEAMTAGDYAKALKLLQPLAEQGDPGAQTSLGIMYGDGLGLPQNEKKAAELFAKAAAQGHAIAQYSLGLMHYEGRGVPKNYELAAYWYTTAAEEVIEAQYNLSAMYYRGESVLQNWVIAYALLNIAGMSGDEDSANLRDELLEQMTSLQIQQGQELSRAMLRPDNFYKALEDAGGKVIFSE